MIDLHKGVFSMLGQNKKVDSRFVESLIDFPVSSKNLFDSDISHSRFVENKISAIPVSSKIEM